MSIFEPSNVCNTLLWMATAGTMSSANIDRAEDTHKHCHSHSASCVSAGKSRVMLLLPDGFDYRLTHRYLDSMPNTRRIMEEGYSGQILPFTSTWGNINFASLITGAPPGTHYRQEKQPDLQDASATPGCAAETIWQALGAEGRKRLHWRNSVSLYNISLSYKDVDY